MGSSIVNEQNERRIELFARFGIVAKGIVYSLVGVFTGLAALGLKREKYDKEEIFKLIYNQPLGGVFLIIVAVGLVGYSMWRFFQAFRDIDNKGSNARGKFTRLGYAISGFIYLTIAFYAVKLDINGFSDDSNSQRFVISKILELPKGDILVGLGAILIFFNGGRQIYKGISGKFMKNISIATGNEGLFKKTGSIGYVSRGVVLIVIGYFFFRAAMYVNENQIEDTKGAFDFIENHYGPSLLALVALGLVCYGIFMFVKARFQKIDLNF